MGPSVTSSRRPSVSATLDSDSEAERLHPWPLRELELSSPSIGRHAERSARGLKSLAIALVCLGSVTATLAGFNVLETDDLRLVYQAPNQSYLAPYVARCFENALRFHRKLWDYTPSGKFTVLLNDFSDAGNASTGAVPENILLMEISPLGLAYETVAPNERMNWLMNHELVHATAVDEASASDRFFRRLFYGKVAPIPEDPETILYSYLTAPRDAAPRWYHEGIAVFIETWMAGGLGRAQGAYDEMVFRSMVRDGSRFYDPLGLASEGNKIDFQLEVNSYLYGTRFMTYLADHYSPEALMQWVGRPEDSRGYYGSQFKKVFGAPLGSVWNEWVAFEHEFQRTNLESVRRYPTTPSKDLSPRALGSISRAYLDKSGGKLYAAFNYPGIVSHVGAISLKDGSVEKIIDIKGPAIYTVTSLAYDPGSQTLFYTTDNNEYRDLRSIDLSTRKSRTLMKDARIGDVAFDPADKSIWGLRHYNGIVTLVRIPPPYTQWNQIHSWPYGEVLHDLDVSPDGTLLSASYGGVDGRHSLRVMKIESLMAGDAAPMLETEPGTAIPENFVFSTDGKYLFGSSYYTGVSNIFRYEIATKNLECMTNAETGFFRPIPLEGDDLIVFRYTGEGFVPATLKATPLQDVSAITFLGQKTIERHPVLKDWSVGSPNAIPLDSMIVRQGAYKSLRSVALESFYPVIEGYKDVLTYGVRANFADPLFLNRGSLTVSYSPLPDPLTAVQTFQSQSRVVIRETDIAPENNERFHVQAEFQHLNWNARYKYNGADFYDIFGPTKTSRKGWSLGLGYKKILIYDRPRQMDLNLDADYYGGLDRLPDFQNVPTSSDRLLTARARLAYKSRRSSLGAVDSEKGWTWDLVLDNNYDFANSKDFPKLRGGLDVGFALPLPHSSIWLRSYAGASPGGRDYDTIDCERDGTPQNCTPLRVEVEDPFADYFFGHFGNNYVDHGEVKRYRDYDAFPGLEINEVGGRNFAKSMLEWNLPPLRFRRVGGPGFYATWARASLFASGLVTNIDCNGRCKDGISVTDLGAPASERRTLKNVGTQVDFQFTVLSHLDMTLSFGYALAFERHEPRKNEFMASLKILR